MPTVEIRHPDGKVQDQAVETALTIGRAEGNDLILTAGGVSRRHARLFVEGGALFVEDVGSANGTFVDGQRIDGPSKVLDGSKVNIGDYELVLKEKRRARGRGDSKPPGAAAGSKPSVPPKSAAGAIPLGPRSTRVVPKQPARVRSAESSPGDGERHLPSIPPRRQDGVELGAEEPKPVLRGLSGLWFNKVFALEGVSVLGRAEECGIRIDDDSVSRRQAEIEVDGDRVLLRDLGSANGTMVNGAEVASEVVLRPGDVIEAGLVELVFEVSYPGQPSSVITGSRRRQSLREVTSNLASDDEGRSWWIYIVGGVLGVALLGGLIVWAFGDGEGGPAGAGRGSKPGPLGAGAAVSPGALDSSSELQESLSQCRTFASFDNHDPDWAKAEAACNKALDLEPIHPEANQLIRKIRLERECADHFAAGQKALSRLHAEEALERFGKIPRESSYFLKAKPLVKQAVESVMKRSMDDCKRYSQSAQWSSAAQRCEDYMRFACQNMEPEQLSPPPGKVLTSRPGRLKKNEWRPKDPMFLKFIAARDRTDPKEAGNPWRCPPMEIFRKEAAVPKPEEIVKQELTKRVEDKDLLAAMMFYFSGRAGDAINLLQRVRERAERAKIHASSDKLRREIASVDQLYKEGGARIQAEDPEGAAEPFREALTLDAEILGSLPHESFFRRNIQQDMAQSCLDRGKDWADRSDFRKACRLWKLGYTFFKGNANLLRALQNQCWSRAAAAFESATDCNGVNEVLDFVAEEDSVREKALQRKAELACQ